MTVTVTDPQSLSASGSFTWTITAGAPACLAVLDGAGKPVLTWTAVAGQTTYAVRRDGAFLITLGAITTYTDTAAPTGSRAYVVRSRIAAVTTDIVCQPTPIAVP